MSDTPNNLASYIWSLADLLRGDFKQSQYGRIILPFTLLRRLECVLDATKADVLAQADKVATMGLPEEAEEKMLLRAAGLSFFNTSKMDLVKARRVGHRGQSRVLRAELLQGRPRDLRAFQVLRVHRSAGRR